VITLSPSKIARYFYHECERHLMYHSLPKAESKRLNIPEELISKDTINPIIATEGFDWEKRVLEDYLKDDVVIANRDATKPITSCYLTHEEVLQELRLPSKTYIYQPSLEVPQSFYRKYNIDQEKIRFSTCRPDLLEVTEVNGVKTFRIIDIKSSEALKISHKIQTAIYALILTAFLEEYEIEGAVDLTQTSIWLHEADSPELTNIHTILPALEEFLQQGLTNLSEKDFEQLSWHLDYRCEWCTLYDYCLDHARKRNHISLLPYLTNYATKFVNEHQLPYTLHDMQTYIQREENLSFLSKSTSFKYRAKRLDKQLTSIIQNEVIPYSSFATDFPKGENIRFLLTVQKDQASGKIFAAAIYRFGGKQLFPEGTDFQAFIATSKEDCKMVGERFVDELYLQLSRIDEYNSRHEQWRDQLMVQTYVTDNYEWQNILFILKELLQDEAYQEKAMQLMFHFHTELLSEAEKQPEKVIPFPLIVLTSVVSRLFAMPAHIALRLEDLAQHIASENDQFAFNYRPKEYFNFKLTNVMKSDIIHQVWKEENSDKVEWVKGELKNRLLLANSVIGGIRKLAKDEKGNELLFAWPERFKMPMKLEYNHPTLAKLAFMAHYEAILSYLEVREKRSRPLNERSEDGTTLILEYLGEQDFLLNNDHIAEELKEGGDWLLAEHNHAGEIEQQIFNDFSNGQNMWSPGKNRNLYFASIKKIKDQNQLTLDLKGSNKFDLVFGESYLLSVRFMDWNTSKVIKELKEIDEANHTKMLQLLEDPTSICKKYKPNWDVEFVVQKVIEKGLTESQQQAFQQFLNHTLTGVWGPPGTGKTHFIATALLLLNSIYQRRGKNLNILVSGFTHTAIENVLVKLKELKGSDAIKIAKVNDVKTEKAKGIEVIYEQQLGSWLAEAESAIVGATLYATHKAYQRGWIEENFDVVVLDEASQIKTSDSLLALSRVKEKGKLLIVGDHYQLPPISKGNYTVKENEHDIYGSIFKLLSDKDDKNKYICQLNENFRMNETLCKYSANEIYGEKYSAFNSVIGQQKIGLDPSSKNQSEWLKEVLDPEYPLIVCVYDGFQGTQENELEAGWVAELTKELRYSLQNKKGEVYEDDIGGDAEFWKHGLFIISPHNAQIRAIKKKLIEQELRPEFFVGSVDKMQGQESDVAIISYGVADPELAVKEGEFIYSLNRLNVSITRAKAKTIIFLSRQLMSPTLQVLGNDEFSEGVNFMIKLERFAKEHGECLEYEDGNVDLMVYRVGQL
jgi:DNA replication ATP-dependent helicase Dna2